MLQALCRRVDELIVSARLPEPVFDWLRESWNPGPFFYGGPPPQPGFHSVGCDNHLAAFMLGRHLRDLGHRKVSYVGFSGGALERGTLARPETMRSRFGLNCSMPFDAGSPGGRGGRTHRVDRPARRRGPPDAVVAFNDLLALGLLNEARALGFRAPERFSIAGFDKSPMAAT